jgi:hypothetical protein
MIIVGIVSSPDQLAMETQREESGIPNGLAMQPVPL